MSNKNLDIYYNFFLSNKHILEKGDKNRARDYCDMGIGYVALKKEKGFDGEDLLENVKINLWLERFWMLLDNNKLLL